MIKAAARVTLLACSLLFAVQAKFLVNDYIIAPKAASMIDKISNELTQKTGVSAYLVMTNEKLGRNVNLFEYSKRFESNVSKPYVIFIFAPNSKRIGLIPSSDVVKAMYDNDDVKSNAIGIIGSKDSNTMQAKYDLGIVQAYSELADEIAESKGVVMTTTIKEGTSWIIDLVRLIVWIGALFVFWVYFGRPIYMRIRHGKQ